MFFSQWTEITLNFTPSAFDRNFCMAYEDGWIYENDYGIDAEWHLLSFEFLT